MTNEQKAKFIADQCKPCTADFYSGIEQGVLLALNSEESIVAKTAKNLEIIDSFVEHLKMHDIIVNEDVVVSFFED